MTANIPLEDEEIAWINGYVAKVRETFEAEFRIAGHRFALWEPLMQRFIGTVDSVMRNGRGYFGAVDEAHNELCIASAILASDNPRILRLDYEPPLTGCAKSIDFRAVAQDESIIYVDVKTIMPAAKDRWEQYEKAMNEEWLPEHVRLVLSKDWLGGEIWHTKFAARGRMLEYSMGLEAKIEDAKLCSENTRFVMAYCGEGVHWHSSELEDFVSFYFNGRHRADDPFSKAELKYMADKHVSLNRTVSSFACMSRPQGIHRQTTICWSVQPPRDAFA